MELEADFVAMLKAWSSRPISMALTVDDDEDQCSLDDLIPDETGLTAEAISTDRHLSQAIRVAWQSLSPQEQAVLSRRFGLDDHPPQSLKQIGLAMDCSSETIRLIEKRALRRLRHPRRSRRLREFA
jgi:RNA polymerase primary sigma factor